VTTITKNIEIPQDRRLRLDLDLPDDLPIGRAELRLTITPERPGRHLFEGPATGCLKDVEGDGVDLQRRWRDEWTEPWEETEAGPGRAEPRVALISAGDLIEKIGGLLPSGELETIRSEARLGYPGKPFNPGQSPVGDHLENG
jgi:hypothetical protein